MRVNSATIKFLIIIISLLPLTAYTQTAEEYTLKATYIDRFIQFVKWEDIIQSRDSLNPFIISVIGDNPFHDHLKEVFAKQKIFGRRVELREISQIEEIGNTHVLFISNSVKDQLSQILDFTKDKKILTVGDTPGFGGKGVLINFLLEENRLHFEVNLAAIKKSGLKIDSYLLDYGKQIGYSEGKDD